MDNKYFLVVSFVAGVIAGFIVGRSSVNNFSAIAPKSGMNVMELEEKIEKAKKLFPSIAETRFVSGLVEEVRDNSFVIKAFNSPNPFEEMPEKREVLVTSSTKIIRMTQKDPKVFQKEIEAAQKNIGKSGELVDYPMPFTEKNIALRDLKAGDQVSVEAADNIKDKASLEAVRVTVQELPASVPIPPQDPSDLKLPTPPPVTNRSNSGSGSLYLPTPPPVKQ